MPDGSIFGNQDENQTNENTANNGNQNESNNPTLAYLRHIQNSVDEILQNTKSMSQTDASTMFQSRDDFERSSSRTTRKTASAREKRSSNLFGKTDVIGDFTDAFEQQILEGLFGSDFKENISETMNEFADSLGMELKDVPEALGKEFGKNVLSKFKDTDFGNDVMSKFQEWKDRQIKEFKDIYQSGVDNYWKNHDGREEAERAAETAKERRKSAEQENSEFRDVSQYSNMSNPYNLERFFQNQSEVGKQDDVPIQDFNLNDLQIYADSVTLITDTFKDTSSMASMQAESDESESALDTLLNLTYGEDESGDSLQDTLKDMMDGSDKHSNNTIGDMAGNVVGDMAGDAIGNAAGNVIGNAAGDALGGAVGGSAAGAAIEGITGMLTKAVPMLGTAVVTLTALDMASDIVAKTLQWTVAPALEGLSSLTESVARSFQRSNESAERNVKLANERFQADVKSMIEEPFKILEEAAQNVYDAWDNNIRLINGTQGYTKEDLQSLMASYSQRLRDDGLSSVVPATDLTESLSKVLESGLSGKIAEEFAYQATILGAAIPSQDFFSYASTYASIAANAVQVGMDQTSAIEYANTQLQDFASNLLYSSRQLSGGFTTGLQNAQELFDQSVKIAQASGTNNASAISSAMTAVSSVVGAVAPDLASSITDAIYNAAVGGNSSEIVALRSLAGINASNTEFLKQLANDPQSVFIDLFDRLGDLQKMSEDNYMEVAEGLSSIFGISMDAFARVDFNALADAISNMNTNTASLEENLKLLASGETTTSKESLKIQQINEYLIDEGLAYVMDNEVARAIQQHMWDEQLAREIMEATYAIELKGSALEFLEGIRHTVDNIMTILNPFNLVDKLTDVIQTADDAQELTADVKTLLETGKVGTGNSQDLYNLTTTNKDLNLTTDIITLMGGKSAYNSSDAILDSISAVTGILGLSSTKIGSMSDSLNQAVISGIDSAMKTYRDSSVDSMYSWNMQVGKSISSYLATSTPSGSSVGSYAGNVAQSSTEAAKEATKGKIDRMLDEEYINKFVEENKTYSDWAATAKNFGISDLSKALQDVGYSEEQVRARFQSGQANYAASKTAERYAREEVFWDNTEAYLVELNEHAIELIDLQTYANEVMDAIYAKEVQFYNAWVDYFVKHTAYTNAYDHSTVSKVQSAEKGKSQDAVYALAEALTKNSVDLLDPTIQTNALLSQILVVVNAIMQQNNESSTGTSLPDALSALAMGLVK